MTGKPALRRRLAAGLVVVTLLIAVALAALANTGRLDRWIDPQSFRLFGNGDARPRVAAVLFSGDMGLRFGMGPKVAPALAARGIPVLGVSSAAEFSTHRSRAEVDAIVARAIRAALRRTQSDKVVLIGQSFGADILATAAPDLPPTLRDHVAAIALVVPGSTAYFRADPLGFAYRGVPDARPAAALRAVRWAPVICIHGVQEDDSLCPQLSATAAAIVALPGGHFLHNDDRLLTATILRQLAQVGVAPGKANR